MSGIMPQYLFQYPTTLGTALFSFLEPAPTCKHHDSATGYNHCGWTTTLFIFEAAGLQPSAKNMEEW